MRWILIILLLLAVVFFSFAIFVRMASPDIASLNVASEPRDIGDATGDNSFTAVRAITTPPEGALTALMAVAEQTPRTTLIAGSVADGIMTFETRSAVMAFPDYTIVSIIPAGAAPSDNSAPLLMIEGRARFGKYDMGVNKARVENWLAQLGPLIATP